MQLSIHLVCPIPVEFDNLYSHCTIDISNNLFDSCLCGAQPVKIGSTYFDTLPSAYIKALSGDIIQAQAVTFSEDVVTFDLNKNIFLWGGYNCFYDDNPDYTTIDGALIITKGTVTVEKLIIK